MCGLLGCEERQEEFCVCEAFLPMALAAARAALEASAALPARATAILEFWYGLCVQSRRSGPFPGIFQNY